MKKRLLVRSSMGLLNKFEGIPPFLKIALLLNTIHQAATGYLMIFEPNAILSPNNSDFLRWSMEIGLASFAISTLSLIALNRSTNTRFFNGSLCVLSAYHFAMLVFAGAHVARTSDDPGKMTAHIIFGIIFCVFFWEKRSKK